MIVDAVVAPQPPHKQHTPATQAHQHRRTHPRTHTHAHAHAHTHTHTHTHARTARTRQQRLAHGPRDGHAIRGAGRAPQLVHNDQAVGGCVVQDVRHLLDGSRGWMGGWTDWSTGRSVVGKRGSLGRLGSWGRGGWPRQSHAKLRQVAPAVGSAPPHSAPQL